LGFDGGLSIGKDAHGAPIWPEGVVGSISHAGGVCIVSAGRRKPELTSLGVDVEKATGLGRGLVDFVCDKFEKETCCNARTADPYVFAKVIFSAKESVYKCLYPITRTVLEFEDVHIQPDALEQKFLATTTGSFHGDAVEGICSGRILHYAGHIYTSCILSVPDGIPHEGAASNYGPVS
ncbi:MAG: 4'-phosphopantetheinyl transferase family protein, partial [Gammaproteobacteria bacterium]